MRLRGGASGLRAHRGVTLPELLVALAVAGAVLLILALNLRSASRSAATLNDRAEAAQSLLLASELLREELSQAGSALPEGSAALPAPHLTLDLTGATHRVRVRYLDDRPLGGAQLRDHRFEAAADSRGEPQLYRAPAGSSRQPLVEGIDGLLISGGIDAEGNPLAAAELTGRRLRALLLTITAGDERITTLISLPTLPAAEPP